jgi:hypothetical protein
MPKNLKCIGQKQRDHESIMGFASSLGITSAFNSGPVFYYARPLCYVHVFPELLYCPRKIVLQV